MLGIGTGRVGARPRGRGDGDAEEQGTVARVGGIPGADVGLVSQVGRSIEDPLDELHGGAGIVDSDVVEDLFDPSESGLRA